MSQYKQFQTQDLNLSAVLIAQGFNLKQVKKNPDGKSTFFFTGSKKIESKIQDYWSNNLSVNPQEIFNALKLLKNRIYSNY
ncbi:MAG: DUF5659 domain-containing protein [Patescibacteria group bacterium]